MRGSGWVVGSGRALAGVARGRPLRVKLISPAKTAADSPYWSSIKQAVKRTPW